MLRLVFVCFFITCSCFTYSQNVPEHLFGNIPEDYKTLIRSLETPPCHKYANKKRQWSYACLGDDILEDEEKFLVYNNGQFLIIQFNIVLDDESLCLMNVNTHVKTYYKLCVQNILTEEVQCSDTHKASKKMLVKTLAFRRLSKFKKMITEHFQRYEMEMCD